MRQVLELAVPPVTRFQWNGESLSASVTSGDRCLIFEVMLEHLSVDGILARVPSNYVAAVVGTGWSFVLWAKELWQMSVIERTMSFNQDGRHLWQFQLKWFEGLVWWGWVDYNYVLYCFVFAYISLCSSTTICVCRCMGGISFCVEASARGNFRKASSRIWLRLTTHFILLEL